MRHIRTGIATVLVVCLAFLAYARVLGQDAARTPGEPKKNHEASSAARQEESKPPKETPEAKPPKTEKQETSKEAVKQQKKAEKEQQKKEKGQQKHEKEQQKHEAKEPQKQAKDQHHASDRQPAGKSAHIPDPQFKAHFGRPHAFTIKRVIRTTTIVSNQTRFVYSGYTFIFLDPWPTEWLLTDDCYIDYVEDEYFLFDVFHPGIRVALFVVG